MGCFDIKIECSLGSHYFHGEFVESIYQFLIVIQEIVVVA